MGAHSQGIQLRLKEKAMQNTASKVPSPALAVEDAVRSLTNWALKKIAEQRVTATRRLTQEEIGKLPENLRQDISSKHQKK
jgi:hypothetical protein